LSVLFHYLFLCCKASHGDFVLTIVISFFFFLCEFFSFVSKRKKEDAVRLLEQHTCENTINHREKELQTIVKMRRVKQNRAHATPRHATPRHATPRHVTTRVSENGRNNALQ
jgi:hypothetical protein